LKKGDVVRLGVLRKGSAAVTEALAAARSARNRATRASHLAASEERASARRYKRARAREDRERARAMNRRVRVTVAEHERPRSKGRTPRNLFYRLGGTAISSRLLSGGTSSGTRSVHFAVTARGFASKGGRAWRDGEGERAAQYITREEALEGGEAGWWSNIADDRNELIAFHRASEALEKHDRANANVYMSEIIALPASLTARQRRKAVRRYCREFDKRGIAYTVGMHKPDPAGDGRNFHCHILYSLRPARRLGAYDWSFAVSKVQDVNTPEGIAMRRKAVVDAINKTLRAAGSAQRYTHLSNRARGLGRPAPKRGQQQTWVARRLSIAQQRCDTLGRLRGHVAALQGGLAVMIKAGDARDLTVSRLEMARNLLRDQMMAYDGRIAMHRVAVAARLDAARLPERTHVFTGAIDAANPVVVDRLRAATALLRWPGLLDHRLAAALDQIAARQRRRKSLEEAAARIATSLREPMPDRHAVLARLTTALQRTMIDQRRQASAMAVLKAQGVLRLYQASRTSDSAANAQLGQLAKHMSERTRFETFRARLRDGLASLPDLDRPEGLVRERLTEAASRQRNILLASIDSLARSSPTVPRQLITTSPPAASMASASLPAHDPVTRPAPAELSPNRPDVTQAHKATPGGNVPKQGVVEQARKLARGRDAGPDTGRRPPAPPKMGKGPDDMTDFPPGGGKGGPGR
jgi:hypothetical protein